MNFRIEMNADGADVRGVSGEISGTLVERERQLRDLFRVAEAAALERHSTPSHIGNGVDQVGVALTGSFAAHRGWAASGKIGGG